MSFSFISLIKYFEPLLFILSLSFFSELTKFIIKLFPLKARQGRQMLFVVTSNYLLICKDIFVFLRKRLKKKTDCVLQHPVFEDFLENTGSEFQFEIFQKLKRLQVFFKVLNRSGFWYSNHSFL